jgi:hypothetical protein
MVVRKDERGRHLVKMGERRYACDLQKDEAEAIVAGRENGSGEYVIIAYRHRDIVAVMKGIELD